MNDKERIKQLEKAIEEARTRMQKAYNRGTYSKFFWSHLDKAMEALTEVVE